MGRSILEESKERFAGLVAENRLHKTDISILVKALSPEEAIGHPGRRDFPIVLGKERVIEAEFLGAKAHAFTDSPSDFSGTLKDVLGLSLSSSRERAILVASMNVVLRRLGLTKATLHCRDEEPEECAREVALHIKNKIGARKVGLVGLNPALAEMIGTTFGPDNVCITDLNKQNIGSVRFGVEVLDGNTMAKRLVAESDLVLLTGTVLVNGAIDGLWEEIRHYGREYLIYGVTSSAVCRLMGLNRICPFGRD